MTRGDDDYADEGKDDGKRSEAFSVLAHSLTSFLT